MHTRFSCLKIRLHNINENEIDKIEIGKKAIIINCTTNLCIEDFVTNLE